MADYADEVNLNLLQIIGEEDNEIDRSSVSAPPSSPSTSSSYPADELTQNQRVADDEANAEDTESDEEFLDVDFGDDHGSSYSEDSDHESDEESAEEPGAEEPTLRRRARRSPALLLHEESEKWLAYENMKEETLEKIRKLEEERHTVDLWSCGPEWGRKRRRRQVTVSPPYVVYMLPDAEIMEDWRLVRKLLERND